jgi:Carboxymuconolactone decarboxylase family
VIFPQPANLSSQMEAKSRGMPMHAPRMSVCPLPKAPHAASYAPYSRVCNASVASVATRTTGILMEFLSTDILKLLLTTICILCFETYHNTLRGTWTAASHSSTARKHSDMAVERNDGVYYWSVLGRHEALSLVGPTMIENIMHFEYEYPALGRYLLEAGFRAMNANAAVGYHEWALTSIAVLIAMGDATDQMDMYLGAALKHGATEAEIQDMVNLASAFAGPPRTINAVRRSTDRPAAARGYELPKERIIRLADHDTLVRDTGGDGTPIILIHALSLDSRMWRDVFPETGCRGASCRL